MQNGHLVYEAQNGQRYLALPRDRRESWKCYHCCFASRQRNTCPHDRDGNFLCDFGHGFTFKRIPQLAKPRLEIASNRPVQDLLIPEMQG